MKRNNIRIIGCVLAVSTLTFTVTFFGSKIENPNLIVTLFIWFVNLLLTCGGAGVIYNDFIRCSGFYIGMKAMLKSLEPFLGDKRHYDSSEVFWIMVEERIAIEHDMANINPSTLGNFKKISNDFFKFICEAKNNVPPNKNAKKWYESQDTIIEFLRWGKNCENEKKLSVANVEIYFSKLVESVDYILKSIDEKIETVQNELEK